MTTTERRFLDGAAFGLIGTLAMSIVMLVQYAAGQSAMAEPAPLSFAARLVAATFGLQKITIAAVLVGLVLHFAYGALWFGLLAVSTQRITWARGLVIGLGLWLVMAIFFVPLAGTMTFSIATTWKLWTFTLIGHAVYGIVGGLAGELYEQHRVAPGVPAGH